MKNRDYNVEGLVFSVTDDFSEPQRGLEMHQKILTKSKGQVLPTHHGLRIMI